MEVKYFLQSQGHVANIAKQLTVLQTGLIENALIASFNLHSAKLQNVTATVVGMKLSLMIVEKRGSVSS